MQTIKPANNQLFCKPDEADKVTKSGFILTSTSVDKPRTAVVVNVGDSVTGFKRDDRVVYKAYSTTEVKLNDEEYLLVSAEDVLGVVVEVES